uniref:Neprosin PEP catalytic domain-containing protein n=1 Tax=Aegilops tauschii subsp. strangulata TaxID=200361 RepID=A0A453B871_AEGTS
EPRLLLLAFLSLEERTGWGHHRLRAHLQPACLRPPFAQEPYYPGSRPAYHPEGLYDESKVASQKQRTQTITQMWHQNGLCQENTIPIRRTKKEDVFRASSIRRYGKKTHLSTPNPSSVDPAMLNENGHQHAIAYVEGDKYYGAKATINVWQPSIQQGNEFSLSQLWILGGSFGQDLNSIEAGWQVSPDLYGDNNTRLFTYWT